MSRREINSLAIYLAFLASLAAFRGTWADEVASKAILKAELGKPLMDLNSHGDVWDSSWADDGHLYVSSDDTRGFIGPGDPKGFSDKPSRNLQFHILQGDSPDSLVGKTINRMDEYHGSSKRGPDGCMWKANGNTCLDGILYMFVSRHGLDFEKRQSAEKSSLIMSSDKGLTWRRSAKENYDRPMFVSPRFGSPMFVKYGRDGRADAHNADKYVYALANNGFWENGDDMILARVLKSQIARLDAKDWQFFTGGDGMSDANWSPDMQQAKPVLVNPGKCGMAGAQYIAPLKRYLMIQWYYTTGSGHKAPKDTTWIFYESPAPWGPWREFGSQRFDPEGYYNPCVVSKFISPDGRNLAIFTNGNFFTARERGEKCIYRLTKIPCTLTLAAP
ncbi:MAG: DUF4185 domain-containing protein [Pirellulales bacterium]|nr:DUF4185 domain-containing protein [Pirellulales bacterium]